MDCPGRGIVIGADDITLDLNGHTIDGDDVPAECPDGSRCDVGVDNSAGHDRVAVEGGTVHGFGVGVRAAGVTGARFQDLLVSNNQDFGMVIVNSTKTVVQKSGFPGNGTSGLVLVDARYASVSRNSVSGSHGYGIVLFRVDGSLIDSNRLDGNDHGILGGASSRNVVSSNVVSHSGGSSLDFGDGATGNLIERNRLVDNGDGIVGTNAYGNVIRDNIVTGTGLYGFPDTGGFGLILDGSDQNTVHGNIITGGRGPAVLVTSLDSPTPSRDNLVSGNFVNSQLADGILVENGATGTRIIGNNAIGSGDDGIDVDASATVLGRNIANHNQDLGIEGIAGMTDGGGNHAGGNGNPLQCTEISC